MKKAETENCVTLLERLRDEVENKDTNKQHKKKSKKTIILSILLFIFMASTVSVSAFAYKLQSEIDNMHLTIENLTEEYTELLNNYYKALSEAGFWSSRYVVTTESGEKYHRCICVYVQGKNRSTWSIKMAQENGYEPCSVCNPGGIDWGDIEHQTEELENELKEKGIGGNRTTQ